MATTVKRIRELDTAATVTDDHYVVLDSDSGATEKTKVASIIEPFKTHPSAAPQRSSIAMA
ncbi:MAG: hypothetical protein IPL91_14970 [Hyphomicrobium sp.]|nr:hypothetical protein [Hyphomicrobium sp.]